MGAEGHFSKILTHAVLAVDKGVVNNCVVICIERSRKQGLVPC